MSNLIPADLPVSLPAGLLFRYHDHVHQTGRTLELERTYASGALDIRDLDTLNRLQLVDEQTGNIVAPTLEWLRQSYADGRLYSYVPEPQTLGQRSARADLLDVESCHAVDPKFRWRHSLAYRALAAGIARSDKACEDWLAVHFGDEDHDTDYAQPDGCTLRRWMTKVDEGGEKVSILVNNSGRRKGQSQLPKELDELLHVAAFFWWTHKRSSKIDAHIFLIAKVARLNRRFPDRATPFKCPSYEALRKRIKRTESYETVKARYGKAAADRRFKASGEPIKVSHLLELVVMDATTLEQSVLFDSDWKLPATKIRITATMDARSGAILSAVAYAGSNRAETSLAAIIDSMVPPNVPEDLLKAEPALAYVFGKPAAILPDNELAMTGPAIAPSLLEARIRLHLPPVEMPTAKSNLERWLGTLKTQLKSLPGTIVDPKRIQEIGVDALKSTELIMPQLQAVIDRLVAQHNNHAEEGEPSPVQIWKALAAMRATQAFENIDHIKRLLGRTEEALLTKNGVERKKIQYRDAEACTALLIDLAHTDDFFTRRDSSGAAKVKIRIPPGNLDSIYVFNPPKNKWIELHSTQPEYTHRLSEFEHDQFRKHAKVRNEPFNTQEQRIASRIRTMRMIDEAAPHLAFQQRKALAALYLSREMKEISSVDLSQLPAADIAFAYADESIFERADDGLPEKMEPRPNGVPMKHRAPARPDSYGRAPANDAAFDWDAVEADPTAFLPRDADQDDEES